jgi:hypothetical protein
MKNTLKVMLASLLLASVTFTACDKNCDCDQPPTSELTVTFKATYDGQPLVKNQKYDYDNFKAQFTRFNTYISNFSLISEGGDVFNLSEITWVDFTPDFASGDNAVDVTVKFDAPQAKYRTVKMGFGVPEELNKKRPSDFEAGHPLSLENEYWSGWKSYIFNKIEGEADSDNNGASDLFLSYHSGSDPVYREYEFPLNFEVGTTPAALTVELDLKRLFNADNTWFDMAAPGNQATSNDISDIRVATILMNNFDNATTVKQ